MTAHAYRAKMTFRIAVPEQITGVAGLAITPERGPGLHRFARTPEIPHIHPHVGEHDATAGLPGSQLT
jgi:hypothetical protein